MPTNDANGPNADGTEPTRGRRSHEEQRDGSAGDFDTISTSDVAVDPDAFDVDTAPSGLAVRLNFWQGGEGTLETDEIGLE